MGLVKGQVNGPRAEIHREGNDAGDEEQKQAKAVEGRDLPVDLVAVRLPAAFRMDERAAARCRASSATEGNDEAPLEHIGNEHPALHRSPGHEA